RPPELVEGAARQGQRRVSSHGIANKIIVKKADWILALKGNRETLLDGIEIFGAERKTKDFKDTAAGRHATIDGGHGRMETRRCTAIHDAPWPKKRHDRAGPNGVVIIESTREAGGKIERKTRVPMTSLAVLAAMIGPAIRGHFAAPTPFWETRQARRNIGRSNVSISSRSFTGETAPGPSRRFRSSSLPGTGRM
ncbi:MAG: ISAs1 family transposase, partial [Candidatus Binataceae bacterium]